MREIYFRGKSLETGEWVYGDLVQLNRESWAILSPEETKVDVNTIGQYTGLNDKNRTKIFEGDIVIRELAYITINASVTWNEKYLQYELNCVSGKYKGDKWWLTSDPQDYELLGNIYDNPELMEVKQ